MTTFHKEVVDLVPWFSYFKIERKSRPSEYSLVSTLIRKAKSAIPWTTNTLIFENHFMGFFSTIFELRGSPTAFIKDIRGPMDQLRLIPNNF